MCLYSFELGAAGRLKVVFHPFQQNLHIFLAPAVLFPGIWGNLLLCSPSDVLATSLVTLTWEPRFKTPYLKAAHTQLHVPVYPSML